VWATWRDFVLDPELRLLGLQAVPSLPDANVLVFDHCCGTSISLLVRRVRHLLPGLDEEPLPPATLGYGECRRHCQQLEDFVACDRPCPKARDRRIVLAILRLRRRAK
jgi:hypothetical protein